MSPFHNILLISLVLLLLTKLADVWTTIRHVGKHGESNPLARRLFDRFGFAGGLAVVVCIWLVIVAMVYVSAWSSPGWVQVISAITAMGVAWVQWDVARFNATQRSSRLTRIAMRVYGRWAKIATTWRWKSRGN